MTTFTFAIIQYAPRELAASIKSTTRVSDRPETQTKMSFAIGSGTNGISSVVCNIGPTGVVDCLYESFVVDGQVKNVGKEVFFFWGESGYKPYGKQIPTTTTIMCMHITSNSNALQCRRLDPQYSPPSTLMA